MLPDLSKLKEELHSFQKDFIRWAMARASGPFAASKRIPLFEGRRHGIERATGEREVEDLKAVDGIIIFKPQEDDLDITFAKLYEMGKQMSEVFQRKAFEELDKILAVKGQSVNATGLSPVEALFEMLEKIAFPLGPDGKLDLSGYKFVGGAKVLEAMIKAWEEILTDPNKSDRLKELEKRKEAEARVREANRKLVG